MLLNAAKFQGYSFYHSWVVKGKPIGGGIKFPPPPPTQIRVKKGCSKVRIIKILWHVIDGWKWN